MASQTSLQITLLSFHSAIARYSRPAAEWPKLKGGWTTCSHILSTCYTKCFCWQILNLIMYTTVPHKYAVHFCITVYTNSHTTYTTYNVQCPAYDCSFWVFSNPKVACTFLLAVIHFQHQLHDFSYKTFLLIYCHPCYNAITRSITRWPILLPNVRLVAISNELTVVILINYRRWKVCGGEKGRMGKRLFSKRTLY